MKGPLGIGVRDSYESQVWIGVRADGKYLLCDVTSALSLDYGSFPVRYGTSASSSILRSSSKWV